MKVLIADKFEKQGLDELAALGCRTSYKPELKDQTLVDALHNEPYDVLIVRSTRVTAEALEGARALKVVIRAGAGTNTIDLPAASARSILVANCPGKNAVAVAELTLGLILALDRRLVENVGDLRAGTWNKAEYSRARGLKGRTLGIVGMGQVGREVTSRARALEMDVIAWSRSLTEHAAAEMDVTPCASPGDVASRCHVLSIHLAATPETKGIINAEVLGRLAPGSYVINTARHEVLDYDALRAAVAARGLRVALDVFPDEPAGGTGEFRPAILDGGGIVYGTHHIGASTDQAQDAIAGEVVRIVACYQRSGRVLNCVNVRTEPQGRFVLAVRHRNQPGVLAHTLDAISQAGVNVEEMENVICQGAESACAQIRLSDRLDDEVLRRIESGSPHIFSVSQLAIADGV
jgi:D-3-phosphoglycerate dehydrogenase